MIPIDETVREFLVESHENLDGLERDLVAIEADPRDAKTLGRIFRTIHTIKGTCGFLALPRLESVAHAGEGLLCELRDGRLAWHAEVTGAMLALVDTLRTTLRSIEATGEEGVGDDEPLVSWLNRLQRGEAGAEVEEPTISDAPTTIDPAPDDDAEPIAEVVAEVCATSADSAMARPVAPVGDGGDGTPGDAAHGNVRVDVGLLDKLMNLVGELVLTRNQILQHAGTRDDSALLGTSQRLNLITTELQEGVMKTRMQPIGTVWNKFPRVVRDLAVACGKRVRIEMEGRETELDRTIIEAIKDPLTHLVRNSIDHGIESSERRVAAGKPAEGRLRLRAYHESGQVNIEISDDGGGIDPARVARVAVERGVVTREQAARMDDREVLQLVFVPGFSTAERVTNISGRGVGMDVVKTNIEKIGGTVDLQSQPGVGTTIKIKIPLTLAIIPALIVTAGGDRYAIPQVNLLELVRLEDARDRGEIAVVDATRLYRLRGDLLPTVELGEALGLRAEQRRLMDDEATVLIVQADGRRFGLVVDGVGDTEEIVVKPLAQHMKSLSQFAGATIMGDGRVALILDIAGIAPGVRLGVAGESVKAKESTRGDGAQDRAAGASFLLFELGETQHAIPMSHVARLEEIRLERIEQSAGRDVIQYRGRILPLLRTAELLDLGATRDGRASARSMIVCHVMGQDVGLAVDGIQDVIEDTRLMDTSSARPGLLGSMVLHDRVTDIVDVAALMRMAGLDRWNWVDDGEQTWRGGLEPMTSERCA